jgi:endonuclease/exonuclease/phosphatase family metal-dependent hydrolase
MKVAKEYKEDERCAAIAAYYNSTTYDVVGFSEVWSDSAKERVCQNFNYHYFIDTEFWKMGSGLALASKYPIYETHFTQFNDLTGEDSGSQKGYIRAVIHTPRSGDFRVYLTHTQANAIIDPGKVGFGHTSVEARKSNLQQIADDMKAFYPHVPAIVLGDLNVIGESEEYNSGPGVFSSMIDTYRTLHTDAEKYKGWTWDADTNQTVKVWDEDATGGERLDYVLYSSSSDWSAISCAVDTDMKESDHYPLIATLELKVNTSYLLADTWEGAAGLAQKWKDQYGTGASTRIVLTNDSDEDIHLVESYDWDGHFFSATPSILPTGKSAGLLHVKPDLLAIGSKGCIIMRQGNLDYFLGFRTPHDASENKVLVECQGNDHWWAVGKDHMEYLLDDSKYQSDHWGLGPNNKYMKIKSGTGKGTSPRAWFTITSKEDPRPVPTLEVNDEEFTYDGQPHPVGATKATGIIPNPMWRNIPQLALYLGTRVNPIQGEFSFAYQPGGSYVPIDADTYKASINFISQDVRFQNAVQEVTIKINKANPKIVVNGGEVTFNENSHPVTASTAGVAGEVLPITVSYQGTTKAGDTYGPTEVPPTVAGEYQVTVSTSGDKNHNAGSKTVALTIKPALAVVIAPKALEVRKGHGTHTNNVGHWLINDDKIEVWDVWRGEDEVWVQHDNSGQHGVGWSAMEYKGETFVEFVTSAEGNLETA